MALPEVDSLNEVLIAALCNIVDGFDLFEAIPPPYLEPFPSVSLHVGTHLNSAEFLELVFSRNHFLLLSPHWPMY